MARVCQNCLFDNPAGMRFCGQCGTRLPGVTGGLPGPGPAPTPGTFSPEQLGVMMGPDLLERFRRAGLEAAGQRRTVTVLFADLAGYTDLSERVDAEELYGLIQQVISLLAASVYRYEGAVDKFTGDGLMALFGAPIAQENSAEMALRAACDMQADLARLAVGLQGRAGGELRLHIGLHAGPVIVGSIGSNMLMNYTAIGDTVNLARRLEEASAPGTILASEVVVQQTQALFDFQPTAPLTLKGIHRPVPGFLVVGPKSQPGSVRGLAGLRAPMIGRAAEQAQLNALVQRLADSGQGAFVLLSGEAGLGKSRLIAELKAAWRGRNVMLLEGHSLTYRRTVPYWIFGDLLRHYLGVTVHTTDGVVRSRLEERAAVALGQRAADALPYLAHLLGLRPEDGTAARISSLDAGQLRQQVFVAVRELLAAEAQRQPTVLIFDDLHWADEVSLDLLQSLLASVAHARLLIIGLTRPVADRPLVELREGAQRRLGRACVLMTLQQLSSEESRRLLGELLTTPDLPAAARELILQRAGGIPFYLEEILRMLIDAGALARQAGQWQVAAGTDLAALGVPDTLQGLILARFDRLSEFQRRTLQVAAVIGRQFNLGLLQAVMGLGPEPPAAGGDDPLRAALQELAEREFVMPRSDTAGLELEFKHALISEAIYSTLLRRDRGELHGLVGQTIESLYADRLDEQIEVLARHYAWSPRLDRALHYSILAGQKAARDHATEQARHNFEQALALLPQVEHKLSQVLEIHTGLGEVLQSAGDYEAARVQFQAGLNAVAARDGVESPARYARERGTLLRMLARTYERQGAHDDALVHLDEAQAALAEAPERLPVERAQVLQDIGWIHFRRGNFEPAQHYLQQALQLVEGGSAYEVIASIYNRLGGLAYSQGDWTQCASYVRKSIALREAIDDIANLANSFNNLGVLEIEMGLYDSALENLRRSYELKRRQGQTDGMAVALNNLGLLHVRRGELAEAGAALREARDMAQQIGYSSLLGSILKHLGELHVAAQEWAQAHETLTQGVGLVQELGAADQLVELYQLLGEVALEQENVREALQWHERTEELCRGNNGKSPRLTDIQSGELKRFRGRLATARCEWAAAVRHLRDSEEIFGGVGNRLYLGRVARDLGWLAERQCEPQRAQLHYREAALLFRSVGARLEGQRAEEAFARAAGRN